MEYQRPSNTSEVKVKVSEFGRGKGKNISWVKLDDNTQLMDHNLPSFIITKRQDDTYPAVTVVSVSCSGDRDVDNKPREGS
jgi:hypothetical protein